MRKMWMLFLVFGLLLAFGVTGCPSKDKKDEPAATDKSDKKDGKKAEDKKAKAKDEGPAALVEWGDKFCAEVKADPKKMVNYFDMKYLMRISLLSQMPEEQLKQLEASGQTLDSLIDTAMKSVNMNDFGATMEKDKSLAECDVTDEKEAVCGDLFKKSAEKGIMDGSMKGVKVEALQKAADQLKIEKCGEVILGKGTDKGTMALAEIGGEWKIIGVWDKIDNLKSNNKNDINWSSFYDYEKQIKENANKMSMAINIVENTDDQGIHKAFQIYPYKSFVSFTGHKNVESVTASLYFPGGEESGLSMLLLGQAFISFCGVKKGDNILDDYITQLFSDIKTAEAEGSANRSEDIGNCNSFTIILKSKPIAIDLTPLTK